MISIKKIHSFSIKSKAINILKIYDIYYLYNICNKLIKNNINYVIIGNSTNTIFLNNFKGYILINKIKGKKIKETKNFWKIHINSGENWNDIVKFTINNNIFGLENMVSIPGKVGAAPIYNIGAYGCEFKDFCEYVNIFNIKNFKIKRLSNKECKFSYRNSIFQNKYNNKYNFIHSIGLKISKIWKPNINHKIFNNKNFNKNSINPKKILKYIYNIRKKNIPDIKLFGNSGSFFKNPIINKKKLYIIKNLFKNIPYIKENKNNVKLYAGWLIEKCNLKNFRVGNISTSNNSLIIINLGNGKKKDLIYLIKKIYYRILRTFNVKLNFEISLIYNSKKVNIEDIIHDYNKII